MNNDIKETRIIVAGSRNFNDYELLSETLDKFFNDNPDINQVRIISGCAQGTDKLGEKYALNHGFKLMRFFANWNKHGKAAGPIRNREMAKYAMEVGSDNAILFAFWDLKSRGTGSMVRIAKKCGMHLIYIFDLNTKSVIKNENEMEKEDRK